MSQAVVALLAALVGAGAAVLGQLIGPVVQSRRAHRHWLRDKRTEVYEDFMADAASASGHLHSLMGSDRSVRNDETYKKLMRDLRAGASRIDLYAMAELREAASDVWVNYQLAYYAYYHESPEQQSGEMRQVFVEDVERVRQLIRKELGVD
ncbi:hypothetical protein [Modestobacter marinus]|uniref:hypothetical protein n=1 Tax=Modestobacter marinus TaxID=477641 RepID=UPI001C95EC1C|nr:hypothetical protein [Modestobacter marinus]